MNRVELGSALQLTPHFHVLLPEAVFEEPRLVPLPPPTTAEVEQLATTERAERGPEFTIAIGGDRRSARTASGP